MGKYSHTSYALLDYLDGLHGYLSSHQDNELAASIMHSSQYRWLSDEVKVAVSRATLGIMRELTGSIVMVVKADGSVLFRGTVKASKGTEFEVLIRDGVTALIDMEKVRHIREPDLNGGAHEVVLKAH